MNQKDFNFMIMCSFRYCLGRRSYTPDYFKEILFSNLNKITPNTRDLIIKEISESGNLGMEIDKKTWIHVQSKLIKLRNMSEE